VPSRREGYRVGRAARHRERLAVAADGQLGEERALPQLGDRHPVEREAELGEEVPHEVVGHWPRRHDALERERDRGGFDGSDEDREHAVLALGLAEQHDRVVGRKFDPHPDEMHLDHGSTLPASGCSRCRAALVLPL